MGTVSAIIKIHFLPPPFSSPHVNNFFAWTPALLNEFGITPRTHISSFSFRDEKVYVLLSSPCLVVTQKKKKKIKWYITSEETGLIPQPFRSYIDQMRPMAVVPALIFGFLPPYPWLWSCNSIRLRPSLGFMQAGAQTINLSSPL